MLKNDKKNGAASRENQSSGFPAMSNTIRAVQLQKMAGGLKFLLEEVEVLYYLCSENKGADQLRCFREADLSDLRLCFRICKMLVFSYGMIGNNLTQSQCLLFIHTGTPLLYSKNGWYTVKSLINAHALINAHPLFGL